jgi:8-oxo-dGTP pyrophosphatase MutT (NUDIX family)
MVKKQKSAGGIVYYIDKKTNEPRFLLVKRHALSKKIEWVAPKGKIQNGELPEQAAIREIGEEVGLPKNTLQVKQVLDTLSLQLYNDQGKLGVDKDITYFLVHYSGNPESVRVAGVE